MAPNRDLSWNLPMPLRWTLLFAWMGIIFMFSADSNSGDTSGGILEVIAGLLSGILGPLGPEERDILHLLLRKTAHFTEYAVLALLWVGVLPPGPRRLLLAWGLATGYAVTDEIHQAFVPERGPSPFDVLVDATGAAVALAAFQRLRGRLLDSVAKIR